MARSILFIIVVCVPTLAWGDIRDLDLSTTLGWDIERVDAHVDAAVSQGDFRFFEMGNAKCHPIDVPQEYRHLVEETRTIHCGCVDHYRDEAEELRARRQVEYARAYNRSLIDRLTADAVASSPFHVVDRLPSPAKIAAQRGRVAERSDVVVRPDLLFKPYFTKFTDAEIGRAAEARHLREWNVDLSQDYELLAINNQPWIGVRARAIDYPSVVTAFSGTLEGRELAVTGISSVYDKALGGAHVTFLVRGANASGWGRVTIQDEGEFAGTLYLGDEVFRVLTLPTYSGTSVVFRVTGSETEEARSRLLAAMGYELLKSAERRHQQIETLWRERHRDELTAGLLTH